MSWKQLPVFLILALWIAAPNTSHGGVLISVPNGSFESTINGVGQLGYNTDATGWTASGFAPLLTAGVADTTGVTSQYGNFQLWGTNNGGLNTITASPDGGNFVALDAQSQTGGPQVGSIQETLTGLTVGDTYSVSFYIAGAQQYNYTDGIRQLKVSVTLAGSTPVVLPSTAPLPYDNSTAILTPAFGFLSGEGFSGWSVRFNWGRIHSRRYH